MTARLMAIVAEGDRGRIYLAPTAEHEAAAREAMPGWTPDMPLPDNPRDFKTPNYGFTSFGDLFTLPRQLTALTTFSDLVGEAMARIRADACAAGFGPSSAEGLPDDDTPLCNGGLGARAYAEAVGVYLSFAIDKGANYWSMLCAWHQTRYGVVSTFGRQALPMAWDYAEANPISDSSGNFLLGVDQAAKMLDGLGNGYSGIANQADATSQAISVEKLVSTDPPYYDNIGYADLSDFF